MLQRALEDGGNTAGDHGARLQQSGGDGGKAFGEVLAMGDTLLLTCILTSDSELDLYR